MTLLPRISAALILCSSPLLMGDETNRALQIQAILQDPVNPGASFYVKTSPTEYGKLELLAERFSDAIQVTATDNVIAFYGSAPADPKLRPPVLAAVTITPGMQRCKLLITPQAPDGKTPYRLLVIDDTPGAFPYGESRIANLTSASLAMQAGSTKIPLPPGIISALEPIKSVDENYMGQTNFYIKSATKNQWAPFVERQVPYLKSVRRIFIIYATPGAVQPAIRTVMENEPYKHTLSEPDPVQRVTSLSVRSTTSP
jgi:hypothetical protein